jgi:adenylate cyclase
MLQQACPMKDIFVELNNSLKELAAFKAEAEFQMAPS